MQIYFLGASRPAIPLTKTISPRGKDAYPLTKYFTSYEEEITSSLDLFNAIKTHAAQGHCLIKGNLSRPLVDEERRGATTTDDATQYICLDFDRHETDNINDDLARMGLGNINYVLQYSASHGLAENEGTLSAHVFMMLSAPVPAPTLKAWLMNINMTLFKDNLHLSRAKTTIRWPLDITTCQNDKLLYIAPPTFIDMKDPLKQRVQYIKRKQEHIDITTLPEIHINVLKNDERKILNELRKAEGLPARTAKTALVNGTEVINKPDVCTVTGIKDNGEFVRLNLNGGDSWAYWHHKDNFELIHDFKADVWYRTKELVPGYYQDLTTQLQAKSETPSDDGDLVLAFRDLRSAEYYNGLWNHKTQNLILHRAKNETQLDHWKRSHGQILGDYIPIWEIEFNPHEHWVLNADDHKINTFRLSQFMTLEPKTSPQSKFPEIMSVIKHMIGYQGPQDDELLHHFINWFACVLQRKERPITAWVFHGHEGCLAGDTEITFSRGKKLGGRPLSIKEAYEKWSGTWKANGKTRKGKKWDTSLPTRALSVRDEFTVGFHEVFRIVESGVKQLYKLTTVDGNSIRVTHEHPFMRPNGSFTKLCDLKKGDVILKRGNKNEHTLLIKGRNKQRATIHSIPHHPHAWQHIINGKNYKRSHKARLVYEAWMNNLDFDNFIAILRQDPIKAKTLDYLDPSIVVHHLDEDCSNDKLENLAIVDKANHDFHHAKTTGLGTVPTIEVAIQSIEIDAVEMTYDMTMKAPYHNYVANGFCVSNTGKGYFFNKIARPLIGLSNTISVTIGTIEDSFNGWQADKLLVFVDEVDVDDFKEKGRITAKLRNAITEPTVPIRYMRQQAIDMPNWGCYIFASNRPQPVFIPMSDRRYNVGNFQNDRLARPNDKKIAAELETFAQFLLAHKADITQANSIIQTAARERIQKLGQTSIVETCTYVREGNFEELWAARPNERLLLQSSILNEQTQMAQAYNLLMRQYAEEIVNGATSYILTRDELMIIMQYNVGNLPRTPNKFTSMMRHNGIELQRLRRKGELITGIHVTWHINEEMRAELLKTLVPSKAPLKKVKG